MRDWFEGQRWYWFSINLSFNVFPWHWTMEWDKHRYWLNTKFGPLGIFVSWLGTEKEEK